MILGAIMLGAAVLVLADQLDRSGSHLTTVAVLGFVAASIAGSGSSAAPAQVPVAIADVPNRSPRDLGGCRVAEVEAGWLGWRLRDPPAGRGRASLSMPT